MEITCEIRTQKIEQFGIENKSDLLSGVCSENINKISVCNKKSLFCVKCMCNNIRINQNWK